MRKVLSKDGTNIAYESIGRGRSLIIVGGALATHAFYTPLAKNLEDCFTVYTYDRRGRGESGDTQSYAIEREVEDIQSLIEITGEDVFLYGHSAGAALSLHASKNIDQISKLVISDIPYTPQSSSDADVIKSFLQERSQINKLVADGDSVGAAKQFLKGFGLSDNDVEEMLASPAGESMKSAAHALPYDYAVLDDGIVPTQLASSINIPVCILADESTVGAAEQLAHLMKNARLSKIESPTHQLSPDNVAMHIKEFLI